VEEDVMTTVSDVMTRGAECARATETLVDAARKMRELDVGSLPICGPDERLQGMITDRDIVVKCVADGSDPSRIQVADLAQGTPVWVAADAPLAEAQRLMAENQVRRLPVIDDHRLVGIVAQADVARAADETATGAVVESISEEV
jgi:CBS domain-containing protein